MGAADVLLSIGLASGLPALESEAIIEGETRGACAGIVVAGAFPEACFLVPRTRRAG